MRIIFLLLLTLIFLGCIGKNKQDNNLGNPIPDREDFLKSLGYLDAYENVGKNQGVTLYDTKLTYDGLNLFCSSHNSTAYLMDMEGRILHQWYIDPQKVWEEFSYMASINSRSTQFRRVHLFQNGDLLGNMEYSGLAKIDKYSNIIWSTQNGEHHDFDFDEEGNIYTLSHKLKYNQKMQPDENQIIEYITIMDENGSLLSEINLLESFKKSGYTTLYETMIRMWDPTHANSIQYLDGSKEKSNPNFKKGNILISLLKINSIIVVNPETEKIVWMVKKINDYYLNHQHEAELLDNGNILFFNNYAGKEQSKVIEFNPNTLNVEWIYPARSGEVLFSKVSGAQQRLPNGNTIITESTNGRILEVTTDGNLVWEYNTPFNVMLEDENLKSVIQHNTRVNYSYAKWVYDYDES